MSEVLEIETDELMSDWCFWISIERAVRDGDGVVEEKLERNFAGGEARYLYKARRSVQGEVQTSWDVPASIYNRYEHGKKVGWLVRYSYKPVTISLSGLFTREARRCIGNLRGLYIRKVQT